MLAFATFSLRGAGDPSTALTRVSACDNAVPTSPCPVYPTEA
jgi:hypothetical protein